MIRQNQLRQRKLAGKPIVNAWLSIGSSYSAELIAHQGFDSATIDMQHGMVGIEQTFAMLQAISTTEVVPLVRPPSNDPSIIMRILDRGAYGIICPMISTSADAERLVRACRYPPTGDRSFGPARALLYGGSGYLAGANTEILIFAMIETAEGLENVKEILATPGLDGVYIGPNDLALSLGHEPIAENPTSRMVEEIAKIRVAAKNADLIAGIFCSDGNAARQRIAEGFDFVTPGNDAMILKAGMQKAVGAAREVESR